MLAKRGPEKGRSSTAALTVVHAARAESALYGTTRLMAALLVSLPEVAVTVMG